MKTSYTILYVVDDDLELLSEAFLRYAGKLTGVHAPGALEGLCTHTGHHVVNG